MTTLSINLIVVDKIDVNNWQLIIIHRSAIFTYHFELIGYWYIWLISIDFIE